MMKVNYPIVTHDGITWTKEALEKIKALEETELMVSELSVTLEGAIQADIKLNLSQSYNLSSYEFFCSDEFINNPDNQILVIEYILKNYVKWL